MHGNVWEWCLDWWADSLSGGSATDPKGPASGMYRVFRGGGWYYYDWDCRSALRWGDVPNFFDYDLGFRLVLAPDP